LESATTSNINSFVESENGYKFTVRYRSREKYGILDG